MEGGGDNASENQDNQQQNMYDDNPYLSLGKSPGHLSQALNQIQIA
jgi:hypothetical protein